MPILPSDTLRIFMLNVGQADTSVIVTPGGRAIVIDAVKPSKLTKLLGDLGLQDDEHICHLIVTHPHDDHYTGCSRLLKDYTVDRVTLAPFWHDAGTPGYHTIVNRIHHGNTPVHFVSGYERIYPDCDEESKPPYEDELYLELLGPSNAMLDDLFTSGKYDRNHLSIMTRLRYGGFSMLIAGDAQMENWAHFDAEGLLTAECDVLRTAHHGSRNGTQWERLKRLAPEHVIISSEPEGGHSIPDLVGASIFHEYERKKHQMCALTHATGSILVTVQKSGAYSLSRFLDAKTENIALAAGVPLTAATNPTQWPELIEERMQ